MFRMRKGGWIYFQKERSNQVKINQCPKCGQEPKVKSISCFGEYITIECCNLRITHRSVSQNEVIAEWNEFTNKMKGESK